MSETAYRRSPRLTRRGRLLLLLFALLLSAGVVLVLVLRETGAPVRTLLIPEGWRATQVYAAVDKRLDLPPGTTRRAAATADLKLPAEAKGNPEGYLFPATYPITDDTTPGGLLAYMVETATKRFGQDHIADGARRAGLTVYQLVTMAGIVQAEADTPADMGKVARVIRNRLAHGMPLQMDSTLNYALNRSTLATTTGDTRIDSPYNTYERKGLPPTPIGNPGQEAVDAAINPPPGTWLYFVTVAPGDTRFTDNYAQHRLNVSEFNENRRSHKETDGAG
ncbi:Endolytic murein transglycosylase [Streptomyces hundungensis]|uniref:Endolytic murein transglycosylase n=1 Tax=Streptomyces hundungensis TaxID=1077946 RepID=A0A387HSG6_9ACTN|nr:endolytic transglycosylase MltG [Streptomyces hundungensis]AYG84297.1 Endolytic murein transglycosylase [Streptomyces hundungensis]